MREPWQNRTDLCVQMVCYVMWERVQEYAYKVGKIALFVRGIYEEVHYRPGNEGAKQCRANFEMCVDAR